MEMILRAPFSQNKHDREAFRQLWNSGYFEMHTPVSRYRLQILKLCISWWLMFESQFNRWISCSCKSDCDRSRELSSLCCCCTSSRISLRSAGADADFSSKGVSSDCSLFLWKNLTRNTLLNLGSGIFEIDRIWKAAEKCSEGIVCEFVQIAETGAAANSSLIIPMLPVFVTLAAVVRRAVICSVGVVLSAGKERIWGASAGSGSRVEKPEFDAWIIMTEIVSITSR